MRKCIRERRVYGSETRQFDIHRNVEMEMEREKQRQRQREQTIVKLKFKTNTLFCTYFMLNEHLIYKPLRSGCHKY